MSALTDLFSWLLAASRDAALLSLAIALVLWICGSRLPARWRHLLWMPVVVRLLMPALPASPVSWQRLWMKAGETPVSVSVESLPSKSIRFSGETEPDSNSSTPFAPGKSIAEGDSDFPSKSRLSLPSAGEGASAPLPAPSIKLGWQDWAALAWMAGFGIYLGLTALGWRRFRRGIAAERRMPSVDEALRKRLEALIAEVADEWKVKPPRLVLTRGGASPALAGLWRPVLLMPEDILLRLEEDSLRRVIAHEMAHLKRRDVLLQWLLWALRGLHWFNPVLWWAFHRMRVEAERATDERVLQRTGGTSEDRSRYGEALLRLLEQSEKGKGGHFPGLIGVLENRNDLRHRIRAIGRFRKRSSRLAALASGFLLVALAAIGLTQAPPPANDAKPAKANPERRGADDTQEAAANPPREAWKLRIEDSQGEAAEGATVFLVSQDNHGRFQVKRAVTGRDGSVTFPEPESEGWDAVHEVFAQHPSGGVAVSGMFRSRMPEPTVDGRPETLRLEPGVTARFRVVDTEGRPISGLPVHVSYLAQSESSGLSKFSRPPRLDGGFFSGTTNADGIVSIENLPPDRLVSVDHRDPRYAMPHGRLDSFRRGLRPGTGETREVVLEPAGSISGQVRLADGRPVAGIPIVVQERSDYPTGGSGGDVITDEDGRYRVDHLPASIYAVKASLPEDLEENLASPVLTHLELASGEHKQDIDLVPSTGGLVFGRATLPGTDKGVPEAMIRAIPESEFSNIESWMTRTDAEGRYQLRVAPGARKVYFGGWAPDGYLGPEGQGTTSLEIRDGSRHEVGFEMRRANRLTGVVLNEQGEPVAGAHVVFRGGSWSGRSHVISGPDGGFGLEPDGKFEAGGLTAWKGDAAIEESVDGWPIGPLTLTLREGALPRLKGRVFDEAGHPVVGAEVGMAQTIPFGGMIASRIVWFKTDGDGRYRTDPIVHFPKWDGAEIELKARIPGGKALPVAKSWDDVRKDSEMPDLVMRKADRSISGKVIDQRGEPVARAVVMEYPSDWEQIPVQTDEEGRFTLSGLIEGRITLKATTRTAGDWTDGGNLGTVAGRENVVIRLLNDEARLEIDRVGQPAPKLEIETWLVDEPKGSPQGRKRLLWFVGYDRSLDFEEKGLQTFTALQQAHADEVECLVIHGPWRVGNVKAALSSVAPDFALPVGIEKDGPGLSLGQKAYGFPNRLLVLIDEEGKVLAQEHQWKKIEEQLGDSAR